MDPFSVQTLFEFGYSWGRSQTTWLGSQNLLTQTEEVMSDCLSSNQKGLNNLWSVNNFIYLELYLLNYSYLIPSYEDILRLNSP